MKRLELSLTAATALVLTSLAPAAAAPQPSPEQRAADLVAQMTLDEKISQLHTTGRGAGGIARLVPGIPRLGIPDFRITNGPAGVGTGSVSEQPDATALPAPVALAASFDTGLARRYGAVEGAETAAVGHSLIEAPDVNMVRVYRNGRAFENYGEDPYLAGQLAAANIQGIQGKGVLAEVKHYTANDQETSRFTINEAIDDRTLHEIHLPAFETAVKQGHVGAVMCAFPRINGTFMCENEHLLDDVLRGQWGFDGFVQSDAGATHSTVGSVEAGQDLELADNGPYDGALKQAVLDGQVSMRQLDTMIERRLATEIRAGLFDHPRTITPIDAAAGGKVAREIAEQSTVLLKNASAQLPLDASALHSVAVIGPYAQAAHPGGGGSSHVNPLYTVSPVQGIQQRVGPDVTVRGSDGSDPAAAAQLAGSSDVAVVVVGDQEREGRDRSSLSLDGDQDDLVRAVAAANPHTIVVVDSGAPVLMPWLDDVPAIVEAWYPGEEDGNALAGVLFGDVNPSGKLPVTFPRTGDQTPVASPDRYPGVDGTSTYAEKLEVGYRWYDAQNQDPLFPFGYGLSYTSFAYDNLDVTPVLEPGGHATVSFDVTNTGDRAGADVAQVYVSDPAAAGEPPKQLKGFRKVFLHPGETKHVTLQLDERAFSVWDPDAQDWTTVDGTYHVSVGDSSRNLPLTGTVDVPKTVGTQPVQVSAPRLVSPGSTATVTTTFRNTGDFPVADVRVALDVPAGWTVTATSPSSFSSVAPRSSTQTTWQLTAPGSPVPGGATLTATARYHRLGDVGTSTDDTGVSVPYAALSDAFDNVAVTDDTATDAGNIDGSGSSYSAQALAAAGVTPGGTVTHGGVSYTWPDVPAGHEDNVLANGQAITLSGSGSTLGLLAASTYGPVAASGTVVYADGTTDEFTAGVPDWYQNPPSGSDPVVTMPYRNRSGNVQQTHDVRVYHVAVPLQQGRNVAAVILPKVGDAAVSGTPALHVFALGMH